MNLLICYHRFDIFIWHLITCFIECGDHVNWFSYLAYIAEPAEHDYRGQIRLPDFEPYNTCRGLCKKKFPDFEFYQIYRSLDNINRNADLINVAKNTVDLDQFTREFYDICNCFKMKNGTIVGLSRPEDENWVFGYASVCGNIRNIFSYISTIKSNNKCLSNLRELSYS